MFEKKMIWHEHEHYAGTDNPGQNFSSSLCPFCHLLQFFSHEMTINSFPNIMHGQSNLTLPLKKSGKSRVINYTNFVDLESPCRNLSSSGFCF